MGPEGTIQPGFFRDLFQSSRCGILTLDVDGRVTTVNHLGRQILGLPEAGPERVPCRELLLDHPALSNVLMDSLRMENPPSRIEIDLQGPRQGRRVIGGTVSHILRTNGSRQGIVFFFKDLTFLEHGEEQERLKDRLAAIGQMAAGLAHEIRNPLVNIGSTATLLKRKLKGNESGILALENIVQEVRRLNQTVTQCLEYAKPVHLRPRAVDLSVLVSEAVEEVKAKWPKSGVTVLHSRDQRVGDLFADGFQLRQVFHNLVANSFDAMHGQGELRVDIRLEAADRGEEGRWSAPGQRESRRFAVVSIRDTGRGISPEVRERLFFPFFTTKSGGSGIGLAVAKKIVDSHRGLIDVESEPGHGATFMVKLPYPGTSPEH